MQISSGLYERKGLGFDKRFIDLMSFKAKYGHCNVSQNCEDASLGRWCCKLRGRIRRCTTIRNHLSHVLGNEDWMSSFRLDEDANGTPWEQVFYQGTGRFFEMVEGEGFKRTFTMKLM